MKTPWHLWLIGVVSLIWNAFGAMDYSMTATRNAAYMASFTPEQLEYFMAFRLGPWRVGLSGSGAAF